MKPPYFHKDRATSLKVRKPCEVCGELFVGGEVTRFCSPKCRRADRAKRQDVNVKARPAKKSKVPAQKKAPCPVKRQGVNYTFLRLPDGWGRAPDFGAGF